MTKLIENLFDGPIDVIGDIHGEIEVLRQLLGHLGYEKQGHHADSRRMIFVGDLVDRGPDSPAVIELVSQFVNNGHAQCILGNHELNLLRNKPKKGNEWFFSELAAVGFRTEIIDFLKTLPLALENEQLRVVHACWHDKSIRQLQDLDSSMAVIDAYNLFELPLNRDFEQPDFTKEELDRILNEKEPQPPFIPGLARHNADYQNGNPVRVLTSGMEIPAADRTPFPAGGKWRMVERQKWWNSYEERVPVIMGHYWRRFGYLPFEKNGKGGPDLFEGIEPHHWMGAANNVYCVDFSVGRRYEARTRSWDENHFKLAAFRWPEKQVVHDDGKCFELFES